MKHGIWNEIWTRVGYFDWRFAAATAAVALVFAVATFGFHL